MSTPDTGFQRWFVQRVFEYEDAALAKLRADRIARAEHWWDKIHAHVHIAGSVKFVALSLWWAFVKFAWLPLAVCAHVVTISFMLAFTYVMTISFPVTGCLCNAFVTWLRNENGSFAVELQNATGHVIFSKERAYTVAHALGFVCTIYDAMFDTFIFMMKGTTSDFVCKSLRDFVNLTSYNKVYVI